MRFIRQIEGRGAPAHGSARRDEVRPSDVVGLAEFGDLSLAQAAEVLDELQATGRWERVLIDDRGRELSPEQANALLGSGAFGFGGGVHAVWRRREPQAVLAA